MENLLELVSQNQYSGITSPILKIGETALLTENGASLTDSTMTFSKIRLIKVDSNKKTYTFVHDGFKLTKTIFILDETRWLEPLFEEFSKWIPRLYLLEVYPIHKVPNEKICKFLKAHNLKTDLDYAVDGHKFYFYTSVEVIETEHLYVELLLALHPKAKANPIVQHMSFVRIIEKETNRNIHVRIKKSHLRCVSDVTFKFVKSEYYPLQSNQTIESTRFWDKNAGQVQGVHVFDYRKTHPNLTFKNRIDLI